MASVAKSVSSGWRKKGNEFYLSASYDLSPCLRRERIQKAISCYSKALENKTNDDELSSAAKNLAMSTWRVAELVTDKYTHVFYLKEASKYFGQAYNAGLSSKPQHWNDSLLATTREFIDDMVNFSQTLRFEERTRLLNSVACEITEGTLKAHAFLQLADAIFDPIIETEVRIFDEDIFMHLCTCESIQAQITGDELFEKILLDEDNLNINMVWEVVDWYKQSILLTREKDVEYEAIGHSRLGKIYDGVLKLKTKAKANFMRCLELVNSMHPRNFTNDKWYQESTEAIAKYQRETVQNEEDAWSVEKNKFLVELHEEINKLEKVSEDAEDLLRHIYNIHPPKNQNHKLNESLLTGETKNLKKALRDGLLHYHPDRLKANDLGKKWVVLCEEITKYLNRKYEVYK